jgi:hypothetical protein
VRWGRSVLVALMCRSAQRDQHSVLEEKLPL